MNWTEKDEIKEGWLKLNDVAQWCLWNRPLFVRLSQRKFKTSKSNRLTSNLNQSGTNLYKDQVAYVFYWNRYSTALLRNAWRKHQWNQIRAILLNQRKYCAVGKLMKKSNMIVNLSLLHKYIFQYFPYRCLFCLSTNLFAAGLN